VGRKWLISCVKRAFEPGCQADYTLVLEGTQGKLKSSALRALSGSEWFTDDISDMGSKDAAIQLQGKWIVELSELDAFRKAEMTTIKAWLVRRTDHYRPPYGRRAEDFPRQNVFAATTNKDDWGMDETGLRRFWPVKVGDIDIEAIIRDRDQIWAEAKFAYDEDEPSFLSETYEALAKEEQHERQDRDAWTDNVIAWLASPSSFSSYAAIDSDRERIYLPEVLQYCLGMQPKDWNHQHKIRVGRILRLAGYVVKRASRAGEDGKRPEYWVKG
jgi:predicted P-loop ATPase